MKRFCFTAIVFGLVLAVRLGGSRAIGPYDDAYHLKRIAFLSTADGRPPTADGPADGGRRSAVVTRGLTALDFDLDRGTRGAFCPWPPLYDLAMGGAARLFGIGSIVWIAPLLFAAFAAMLTWVLCGTDSWFLCGTDTLVGAEPEEAQTRVSVPQQATVSLPHMTAGVVAGCGIALAPYLIGVSRIASIDHHWVEPVLAVAILAAVVRRSAAGLALAITAALFVQTALIVACGLALLAIVCIDRSRSALRAGAIAFAIASAAVFVYALTRPPAYPGGAWFLGTTHAALLAAAAVACGIGWLLAPTNRACHAERARCVCHAEPAKRVCHCEPAKHVCHSERAKHVCHSEPAKHVCHSERAKHVCHSERSEEPGGAGGALTEVVEERADPPAQVPRYARNDTVYARNDTAHTRNDTAHTRNGAVDDRNDTPLPVAHAAAALAAGAALLIPFGATLAHGAHFFAGDPWLRSIVEFQPMFRDPSRFGTDLANMGGGVIALIIAMIAARNEGCRRAAARPCAIVLLFSIAYSVLAFSSRRFLVPGIAMFVIAGAIAAASRNRRIAAAAIALTLLPPIAYDVYAAAHPEPQKADPVLSLAAEIVPLPPGRVLAPWHAGHAIDVFGRHAVVIDNFGSMPDAALFASANAALLETSPAALRSWCLAHNVRYLALADPAKHLPAAAACAGLDPRTPLAGTVWARLWGGETIAAFTRVSKHVWSVR